jgi:hypothetical protein
MPAGNDASAAATELADKFGRGDARAEQIIEAARSRRSSDVNQAQLQPKDVDATEALDLKAVASAASVKTVDAASVRGEFVVYVSTDELGRAFKGAVKVADVGKKKATATKPKSSSSSKSDSTTKS